MDLLGKRFPISNSIIDEPIQFNGFIILQDNNRDISMSMMEYAASVSAIEMTLKRRNQDEQKVTEQEYTSFKSLTGGSMFLGRAVSPQSYGVSSNLQQRTSDLRVIHFTEANKLLRHLKALPARYVTPRCSV